MKSIRRGQEAIAEPSVWTFVASAQCYCQGCLSCKVPPHKSVAIKFRRPTACCRFMAAKPLHLRSAPAKALTSQMLSPNVNFMFNLVGPISIVWIHINEHSI